MRISKRVTYVGPETPPYNVPAPPRHFCVVRAQHTLWFKKKATCKCFSFTMSYEQNYQSTGLVCLCEKYYMLFICLITMRFCCVFFFSVYKSLARVNIFLLSYSLFLNVF